MVKDKQAGIAKKDLNPGDEIICIRDSSGHWSSEQINLTESYAKKLEKKYQEAKKNG